MDARTLDKSILQAFPLTTFQTFLSARGLKDASIAMYCTQVRRALRQATPGSYPTASDVIAALKETPRYQRNMFRTAWRHYISFTKSKGIELPKLPEDAVEADWLTPVRENLPLLVALLGGYSQPQITVRELYSLSYKKIEDRRNGIMFDFSYALPGTRGATKINKRFLPTEPKSNLDPYLAIMEWGYPVAAMGTDRPDSDAPFLPNGPLANVPLPHKAIERILIAGKKKWMSGTLVQLPIATAAPAQSWSPMTKLPEESSYDPEPLFGPEDMGGAGGKPG